MFRESIVAGLYNDCWKDSIQRMNSLFVIWSLICIFGDVPPLACLSAGLTFVKAYHPEADPGSWQLRLPTGYYLYFRRVIGNSQRMTPGRTPTSGRTFQHFGSSLRKIEAVYGMSISVSPHRMYDHFYLSEYLAFILSFLSQRNAR